MNSATYLMNYGWTEGEALRLGGLKKPILVKHKKDSKGLGHNADQQEAWWERVFDGQLKSLEVGGSSDGVSFVQKEVKVSGISKNVSPLYRMFRYGGILEGSLKEVKISISENTSDSANSSGSSSSSDEKDKKKGKKSKKEKKSKDSKKKDKSKKSVSGSKVSKDNDKSSSSLSKTDKKKNKKKIKQQSKAEAEWIKQVLAQVVPPVQA